MLDIRKEFQGIQKQITGLFEDFAQVNSNRIFTSSLERRTTGQMFAQRPTVHNSVYNQLLGWWFAKQNQNTKQKHPSLNAQGHRNWIR